MCACVKIIPKSDSIVQDVVQSLTTKQAYVSMARNTDLTRWISQTSLQLASLHQLPCPVRQHHLIHGWLEERRSKTPLASAHPRQRKDHVYGRHRAQCGISARGFGAVRLGSVPGPAVPSRCEPISCGIPGATNHWDRAALTQGVSFLGSHDHAHRRVPRQPGEVARLLSRGDEAG